VSDTALLAGIVSFLAVAAFLNLYVPDKYQFISDFDFVAMIIETAGITGACVVTTGIVCAIAVAAVAIFNTATFVFGYATWTTALIVTPMTFMISYILFRLARGMGGG
jgi:hypothetical protein